MISPMNDERVVTVPPERLAKWLAGFAERHGQPSVDVSESAVVATAPDGATAEFAIDLPPLAVDPDDHWRGLVAHVTKPRTLGILLVRRGGYAAGVFAGPTLVASKVDSRYVQGRTAAGGQSQQRFARRRANQANAVVGSAADVAERVLLSRVDTIEALYVGGDRPLVTAAMEDRRLARLTALPRGRFLTVADPRLDVLKAAAETARSVVVRVSQPAGT